MRKMFHVKHLLSQSQLAHPRLVSQVLGIGVLLLVWLSLHQGAGNVSVWEGMCAWWQGAQTPAALIVGEIRLPRLLLALGIGSTLGLAGAALQGLLRNPLADPGILGLSGWASLGAVCVYYTGLAHAAPLVLPLAALAGAGIATLALLRLGRRGALVLILAGMALSALSMALLSLVLNLVPSPYAAYEIMRWLMGSLSQDSWPEVMLAFPGLVLGAGLLLSCGPGLDGLALGEDVGRSMGFSPRHVQRRVVVGTALVVGSGVAVSGNIGFVGLVVPHMMRGLVGGQPSRLLLPSALAGAGLLTGADMLVRLPLTQGAELQLGVVTALIGTPVFLMQIWKLRSGQGAAI